MDVFLFGGGSKFFYEVIFESLFFLGIIFVLNIILGEFVVFSSRFVVFFGIVFFIIFSFGFSNIGFVFG